RRRRGERNRSERPPGGGEAPPGLGERGRGRQGRVSPWLAEPLEHHLEERRTPRIAGRVQALDQERKGIVLMRDRLDDLAAHTPEKRLEGRIIGEVGTEYDRIDEVPDDIGEAAMSLSQHGR